MYEFGYGVEKDYAEARKWYLKAAEANDAWSQNKMGDMCYYGRGKDIDYAEAAKWYLKAADQGNAKAQNRLGYMYETGKGITKDYGESLKWYLKAAEQGYAVAQGNVGLMFENGRGTTKDYIEAAKWYLKAAEQGNAYAQKNLGSLYLNGNGGTKDYAEALKWFRKSAEQNYAAAEHSIGYMYREGYGVNQDYSEALKWYRKAAEQGYARAQGYLGDVCRDGLLGTTQDYEEAIKWYRKAAEQGDLSSQVSLGWMLERGYGVSKDITEAVKLYLSAAEKGNATAQANMGVMYENGTGVEQDYKEALRWYKKSVESGGNEGMCGLGRLYKGGKGVQKNYSLAMEWYQKAAAQGNSTAMRLIGELFEHGYGVLRNYLIAEDWYKKSIEKAPSYGDDLAKSQTALARIQQKIANEPEGSEALERNEQLLKVNPAINDQTVVTLQKAPTPVTPASKVTPNVAIIDFVNNSLSFVDPSKSNVIKTNGEYKIKFQILNSGSGVAKDCKVKVSATGDVKDISFKDMALSDLSPKDTMTVEIPINSGANISNGQVEFSIQVDEPNGFGTDPQFITVTTRGFEAPLVKIADYSLTGTNGKVLKKKQPFDLQLMLQNTKYGQADNVTIDVELPENVISLDDGELSKSFAKLAGGESKSLVYSLIVNNNYAKTVIPIKIHLNEKYGKYAEDRTISLNIDQDFAKSKLTVTENKQVRSALEKLNAGSDVDKDIPKTKEQQENTYAVIITNENYKMVEHVPYALNDGEIFMTYCKDALGIPENHFLIRQDATSGELLSAINWIKDVSRINEGNVNVLFYYAGHGVPNDLGSDAYLLPVDGDSRTVEVCYPVSKLYQELGGMNAKRVFVFMDACFSGSLRGKGSLNKARGVAIKVRNQLLKGNMVVFSAATGDETAWPYEEQEHGLFTYFLLKKLKESGGNCTLGELGEYIKKNVSQNSIVVNKKSQTPTIMSSGSLNDTWQQMKLK